MLGNGQSTAQAIQEGDQAAMKTPKRLRIHLEAQKRALYGKRCIVRATRAQGRIIDPAALEGIKVNVGPDEGSCSHFRRHDVSVSTPTATATKLSMCVLQTSLAY